MKVKDHFSNEEVQHFCQRSDLLAWFTILVNWGLIALAFTLVSLWPNPLTIVLTLVLLGGRQLGLGVLMHECGHGTLFQSKGLNRFVGKWLCAGPVMYRLDEYMDNHLSHHANAGSEQDPDLHRYQRYPVSAKSLRRKLFRDLSGRTALGFLRSTFRRNAMVHHDDGTQYSLIRLLKRLHGPLVSNLCLLGMLYAFGIAELYLLWVVAYFSFYMFFSRIRNLAEHACVPDLFSPDPMLHTRTTIASWWERLTFAPNGVNFHLEHHLLPSVPKYRLADFHRALRKKGLLDGVDIEQGYYSFSKRLILPIV